MRWNGADPMAQDYPHQSVYTYMGADPVNMVDPDGGRYQKPEPGTGDTPFGPASIPMASILGDAGAPVWTKPGSWLGSGNYGYSTMQIVASLWYATPSGTSYTYYNNGTDTWEGRRVTAVGVVYTPENQLEYVEGSATRVVANENGTFTAYYLVDYAIGQTFDAVTFSDKKTMGHYYALIGWLTRINASITLDAITNTINGLINLGQDGIYIKGDKDPGHGSNLGYSNDYGWYIQWSYNSGVKYDAHGHYLDPGGKLIQQFGEIGAIALTGSKSPEAYANYRNMNFLPSEFLQYDSDARARYARWNWDTTTEAAKISQYVFYVEQAYGFETGRFSPKSIQPYYRLSTPGYIVTWFPDRSFWRRIRNY